MSTSALPPLRVLHANEADIPVIGALADATWHVAYGQILSREQLDYMLALMYTPEALRNQMREQHHVFHLVLAGERPIGFASHGPACTDSCCTRLHKLYVLPAMQGGGAGRALLNTVVEAATRAGHQWVELNVNRFNPARGFYERAGFKVVRDKVIDIGNGFVMDDHVMRLDLA